MDDGGETSAVDSQNDRSLEEQVGNPIRQPREFYRVDEEDCTFGTVTTKGEYRPKSNFSMHLETYVDGENAGFFVWVKRKSDGQKKLCFYTTDSLILKQLFLKDIKMTFGSGGFVCSFSEKELSEFHQHLEKSFNFDDPMHVKKGLICAGKQPDSDIWVLNKELHINEDGVQVPPRESKYAWQPLGGPCIDLPGKSASQTIDLQCDICLPLQSRVPLQNLLHAMRSVFKHNFIASVLSVSAALMALHYELIVKTFDACPIPMLVGESETGKSTAVRCALSLCGQENVGHLMKTKNTSDTMCIERCCKSTIPFSLDDPKTADGIGELLIDLCNGRLMGNMKVGLRKPRCIPLICCNFTMGNLHRYSSRALVIPFNPPSIGPRSEIQSRDFGLLATAQREASSTIGWAISLGKSFKLSGVSDVQHRINPAVRIRLPGVDPRLCTGYSCLLYFAEKIVEEGQMTDVKEELEEFLQEILPLLVTSSTPNDPTQRSDAHLDLLINFFTKAAKWAERLVDAGEIYKVLRSMKSGVSYQGKQAVAVCVDDLSGPLHISTDNVRRAVKESGCGKHNVSKDFLAIDSTNPVIKRGDNSRSRKCTVVFVDILPDSLQQKLLRVSSPGRTNAPHVHEFVTPIPRSKDVTPTPQHEDVTLTPQSEDVTQHEDVTPTPQSEDLIPTPQHEDITPTPQHQNVTPTPQHEDVTPTPQSADITLVSQSEDVTPTPQHEDIIPTPHVTPTPQHKDVTQTPQHEDIALTPQHEDITPTPQSEDVTPIPHHEDITLTPQSEDVTPTPQHKDDHVPEEHPPPRKRRRRQYYTASQFRVTRQSSKALSWNKKLDADCPLSADDK